jgi:FtsP/CotA-like multicopper oxidase with cupredoxin domain
MTGLVAPDGVTPLSTKVWGYGEGGVYTWPGKTFEVSRSSNPYTVTWNNELVKKNGKPLDHLLPVDESLHWCFSLPGYEQYSIKRDGVPIITHLHGGHSDWQFDGNPEFFYTPGNTVTGPQWNNVPGGFTNNFEYDIDVPAGNLWYHDHALGITRLNVYAGMAGFFFVRDEYDPGTLTIGDGSNDLGLPKYPYELAYAIQDRMFKDDGNLFYPSRPGDPFWVDFITNLGLSDGAVPKPSALAEFFGDHMVVNGVIWPKEDVEPRPYRMRLLNGCDSRFMVLQFHAVAEGATTVPGQGVDTLDFYVIGSDQGLADQATLTDTLVFEPGGRYDIVIDFDQVSPNSRVIMANYGGDAPYGGGIPGAGPFTETDRVMAFDVVVPLGSLDPSQGIVFDETVIGQQAGHAPLGDYDRIRKVALFEGTDEYGRLQPLLGTAEDATDYDGNPINYMAGDPNTGLINGSVAWHSPTTENPAFDDTEEWWIYNATPDAHPIHLHLVHFEILERRTFVADVVPIDVLQHNDTLGTGSRLANIVEGGGTVDPDPAAGYVENAPKDMVTALPGQVTKIKAKFDKAGRYVWHCHILSHEDHEMMRVLHVGPGA